MSSTSLSSSSTSRAAQKQLLTASKLCQLDDLATMIVVDSFLGSKNLKNINKDTFLLLLSSSNTII
jgi:hypothetical protein